MTRQDGLDVARQVFVAAAAVFHVLAGLLSPVGTVADESPSLLQPATYAFFVWAPIFLLSLAYAFYGMLPANRGKPLLRRASLLLAGSFVFNGFWEALIGLRRPLLEQGLVVGILLCAGGAYLRVVRGGSRGYLGRGERWIVVPTIGLFFGWITAATVVGLGGTVLSLGMPSDGPGDALLAAAFLLGGAVFASAAILAGRSGPVQAYALYAAAVLWGFVAIAVNQADASTAVAGAALISAGLVGAALLMGVARRRRASTDLGRAESGVV